LVVGGRTPDLHKLTLPQGSETAAWPYAGQSVTAFAYSPDGALLAEGSTDGDVALRDPDTGTINRRLTGLHKQVVGFVFTPTHLWAGGADRKLLRWPLADGTTSDREIPETSPISNLASTPDGRYFIAALDDGAMVHALPEGTPVARLIPFRDRSWATLYADGRFVASDGAALSLRVENPTTRQVATLGQPFEPASIGLPTATRLATGHARIRATVFSPSGPPRVRLDDRWDLISLTPSTGNLAAYDVDIDIDDSSARPHQLTVIPPEGASVRGDFTPPSAVHTARALLIGNATYRDPAVPKLPGALKDATDLAHALQGPETWHLAPDRVRLAPDLDAATLDREVRAFFDNATPEETLLFYFAGHGDKQGAEGYLLPIDHTPGKTTGRLSASALFTLIEHTKAERVIIILDACRAGTFLFPESAASRAETSPKPVAFLTSTSASTTAADTARGGPFTQAIVRALNRVESIAASAGAVTVQSAYLYATGEASDQSPRLRGTLDQLPLAWPRDPNVKPTSTALKTQGATQGTSITELTASLETRQISAAGSIKENKRTGERNLQVSALLGEDAEWIRVGVYAFAEKTAPRSRSSPPASTPPASTRASASPWRSRCAKASRPGPTASRSSPADRTPPAAATPRRSSTSSCEPPWSEASTPERPAARRRWCGSIRRGACRRDDGAP
jgi:hypothetical protein